MKEKKKKLLFITNIDYFLISHRLPIACEAMKKGYEVHLATKITTYSREIESYGIIVHPIRISRSGIALKDLLKTCKDIFHIIKKINPKIVHLISIKPLLLGGLVLHLINKKPRIIAAVSGLGYVFTNTGFKNKLIKLFSLLLYKLSLNHRDLICIVQNRDDFNFINRISSVSHKNIILVPGSGVNLSLFCPQNPINKITVVLFPARIVKNKGFLEFIQAAKVLRNKARFAVSGFIDLDSKDCISQKYLDKLIKKRIIEYWGFSTKMHETLAKSDIVVLPSYREGLPKVLCEAAACAKPIITTDVPGCRDAIIDGETGILVPKKDHKALIKAIEFLISKPEYAINLGISGRNFAESKFDINNIVKTHMDLYHKCE